ncbi:EutN/CcmL family microcompartment protein [Mesobacillus zeae]|uniref:Ethanolamine utilization protein EutN n=1 Tax=Mesobacillus zeae TaxID=1917180 RepID=A0A398B9C6_9BACI|nr:EutN/CcmL family microcompartment protein [Mesobacillus zeae]RID84263.1 ethanolamine utilization protein EutN [Mesobacillus zeae]
MMIGRVISNIVSTRKYDELQGLKLLVIQPYYGNMEDCFVAADEIGAGEGELVLVSRGSMVANGLKKNAPVDAVVVGIVDNEPIIK